MKVIWTIISLIGFLNGSSQCNCDSLNIIDSLKTELIYQYKDKISQLDTVEKALDMKIATLEAIVKKQEFIITQDTIMFQNYDRQIELLNRNIELYLDHINKTRPRWYDSKIIYFIGGVATIYAGSLVVKNVK